MNPLPDFVSEHRALLGLEREPPISETEIERDKRQTERLRAKLAALPAWESADRAA